MENGTYTQDGTVDLHGRPALAAKTGRWKACSFLVGYEAFERMAFYGVASNLVVYLTTKLHQDTVSSVRSVNNWSGSVWITPILGAYLADTYFGRFWTFTISSLIYVLGMVLLTMAVSLKSLRPSCVAGGSCGKATPSQMAFFFSALYIIAVGAGGTKPNISTFGADQFDDFDPEEKRLKVSFFNWWMFSSFLGALMATLGLVYIQENLGWGIGYGIPTTGLIVSLLIFYVGTPNYRHKVRKTKSPAREIVGVLAAAFANRRLRLPEDPSELYELEPQHYVMTAKRRVHHSSAFRILDKAALKDKRRPKPYTVTQAEETKLVLGMALIWLTTLIPCTIFAQVNTLFVKQGTTLDRSVGAAGGFRIPAASLGSFVTVFMLLSIPLYDRLLVPFMRRRTGLPRGITLLQRLGVGFASHILVTAVACSVELRRMRVIRSRHASGPNDIVPMSIFWLLPQYALLGIGDVFTAIGLLEFFYDQSPEGMQSLGTTFFTSGIGVGNFLNSLLVTAVDKLSRRGGGKSWIGNNLNDSHLDYYYGFLMAISALNLAAFVAVASRYNYKEETMEETLGDATKEDGVEMEAKGAQDDSSSSLQV
ncbi:putative peptide/nitrate transporter [Apostasia shenzhenica]|uniref:Putative peptide/nitrate transporter n=1 Tax=Apostasia shenzhenica TaxID=1088818 RepID=A0A2I0BHG1_9ASPA|nr:putative peptide/nitrate transporter [Apostasia shenzhenica]